MYIDTHAHIYLKQFDEDRDTIINNCIKNGVSHICMPNIDSSHTNQLIYVEDRYPTICMSMMGLHPCSVKTNYKDELRHVEDQLSQRSFIAVGEIGIDLYWDKTFVKEQEEAFRIQIALAKKEGLPIVIHSRDSLDLTIAIVREMQDGSLTGIFHCFNGTVEQGREITDIGFFMGIGGVLTFKNAGVDRVVGDLPLDRMVLETDAPYLAPVPFRGKRNSPEYIPAIAEKLAEIKGVTSDEIARVTTQNAKNIYRI